VVDTTVVLLLVCMLVDMAGGARVSVVGIAVEVASVIVATQCVIVTQMEGAAYLMY